MRHRKSGIKLNRTGSHRQAMFRNMVTSLFKYDRIKTTDAKAKELRRWADHLVTLAKKGDLHSRRQALAIVREKNVVHKLFEEAQKRFGKISGGYTRIIKVGRRPGDAAPVSIIELVDHDDHARKKKAKKKVKPAKKEARKTVAKEPAVEDKTDEKSSAAEPKEDAEKVSEASSEPDEAGFEPENAEADDKASAGEQEASDLAAEKEAAGKQDTEGIEAEETRSEAGGKEDQQKE